ncbi:hypothetical protein LIER_31016 [Lithospermum erythrorhizon]|uniref:Uncharacterized protein n=1 Tax=Lithospermum erythrorhizon TaxID=34254 RepID=A0AAV3RQ87_LITER
MVRDQFRLLDFIVSQQLVDHKLRVSIDFQLVAFGTLLHCLTNYGLKKTSKVVYVALEILMQHFIKYLLDSYLVDFSCILQSEWRGLVALRPLGVRTDVSCSSAGAILI